MQLIGTATPDVPNQTPIPQPSKQLMNACPIPPMHVIVRLLPSRGPKRGRKCYGTPAFSGIPKQRRTKSEVATKSITKIVPVSSIAPEGWGPKEGGDATSPLHSRGSPNKRGQNQNWLPHPCLLGGPKEGGNATPPLHSRGSPTKGTKLDLKTYMRGNNDAPSISKYGSLVRANAQNSYTALSAPP